MSPATTSSTASPSASTKPDATAKSDHRILIVVVILGIVAAFLISYIVYITVRLKRRQTSGDDLGPYQGTAMNQDHPAANITPFGSVGPHSGANFPRFSAYLLTVLLFTHLLISFFLLTCRIQSRRGNAHRYSSPRWGMALYRFQDPFHTRGCIRNRCRSITHILQIFSQLALLPLKLAISFKQSQRSKGRSRSIRRLWFRSQPHGSSTACVSSRSMSRPL